MSNGDIYAAPEATLTTNEHSGDYGSLERGIAGDYEFSIGGTLSEAWSRVSGRKMAMFLALLVYFAAYFGISIAASLVAGVIGIVSPSASQAISVISMFVLMLAFIPMNAGFLMLGVKGAVDQPLDASSIFQYFDKTLNLIAATFIMYVFIFVGYMLFILPGIYFSVAYIMATPLIAEKGLGPWEALEASRKAVTKRWLPIFGLLMIMGGIAMIGVLTFGIAMIWLGPLCLLCLGVMYRNMFGVEGPVN